MYVIGVDVGGTNTDVVVLRVESMTMPMTTNEDDGGAHPSLLLSSSEGPQHEHPTLSIVRATKQPTTSDVTTGISNAISACMRADVEAGLPKIEPSDIACVMIGTTHFLNAVIQRKDLERVAVIRLCAEGTRATPPFIHFPDDLRHLIEGHSACVTGGYEYDGTLTADVCEDEIKQFCNDVREKGIKYAVVCGVFSPIRDEQELLVANIIERELSDYGIDVTLSSRIGTIGILERENAAILNASLRRLAKRTITSSFYEALATLGLTDCPLFLTQNDGTLMKADYAVEYPIYTFESGPTNSMRGAGYLSKKKDAVIVDIGGTTTDIGVLRHGFPRGASTEVSIGGIPTNFRMPDVYSFGLGGGSVVRVSQPDGSFTIGPDSVGYELTKKGIAFGGDVLTTTDIAIAAGLCEGLGDKSRLDHLDPAFVHRVLNRIKHLVLEGIDQVKLDNSQVDVIVVGGGSILLGSDFEATKPPHFGCANAIGAAIAQVSSVLDTVELYAKGTRDQVLESLKQKTVEQVIASGAIPESVEIVEIEEISVMFLMNRCRVRIKAVGDLDMNSLMTNKPVPMTISDSHGASSATSATASTSVPAVVSTRTETATATTPIPVASLPSTAPQTPALSSNVRAEFEKRYTPVLSPDKREWLLNKDDIECVSIGMGILGSGGGGSPSLGKIIANSQLDNGRQIRVIHPSHLTPDDLVSVIAFMGAPTVIVEKTMGGKEALCALQAVERVVGKITALMSLEIGGLNGLQPLIVGAMQNLPVVDGDLMGRAFPELNMTSQYIFGKTLTPCSIADDKGNALVLERAVSTKAIESLLRSIVVQMGCTAVITTPPMRKHDIDEYGVKFSISRAWWIGREVLIARALKQDPVKAVLESQGGALLFKGKVTDVQRETESGFAKGQITLQGLHEFKAEQMKIDFQNEYIIASKRPTEDQQETVVATTPDIISIVDSDTGTPIGSEGVKFGFRVSVIGLMINPLMRNAEAMKVLGPRAFHYDVDYTPLGRYTPTTPIIPL